MSSMVHKAVLLALLLPGVAALRASQAPGFTPQSEWSYYPPGAKLGIVTGGTPDLYQMMNYGAKDASVMLKYAKRHGYAFFVDKNWGRLSDRRKGWNKVILMHKLLREVPTLVWMDADILLQELDRPIDELMQKAHCNGLKQDQWQPYLPVLPNNHTFLWLNADVSPHRNIVNANTAMVMLKQTPEAFKFLQDVWEIGSKPDHFMHHSDPMRHFRQNSTHPDYGWPFEQGAFWDVMAKDPEIMKGVCIAPGTYFHSVRAYMYQKGQFAVHMSGLTDKLRREQAQLMLNKAGGRPDIH